MVNMELILYLVIDVRRSGHNLRALAVCLNVSAEKPKPKNVANFTQLVNSVEHTLPRL